MLGLCDGGEVLRWAGERESGSQLEASPDHSVALLVIFNFLLPPHTQHPPPCQYYLILHFHPYQNIFLGENVSKKKRGGGRESVSQLGASAARCPLYCFWFAAAQSCSAHSCSAHSCSAHLVPTAQAGASQVFPTDMQVDVLISLQIGWGTLLESTCPTPTCHESWSAN